MNEQSQPSDKLREILSKARQQTPQAGPALDPAEAEVAADALVDKDAALPDPLALSRLYQSTDLRNRLPEDIAEKEEPRKRAPGWEELPPPASRSSATEVEGESIPSLGPSAEPDAMSRPSMTPSEMRAVMNELQDRFQVSDRSYETYELSSQPVDDAPVGTTREERVAEDAAELHAMEEALGGTWLYFLGAGAVVLVVAVFIVLAMNGPLKPPAVAPSAPATTSPAPTHS